MKHWAIVIFSLFSFAFVLPTVADDYEYEEEEYPEDYGTVDQTAFADPAVANQPITMATGDAVDDCTKRQISINSGASPVAASDFDIAGIMLGMDFETAQMTARETGLYVNRDKNSVIYSVHKDWQYNLDYECRQQKIFIPEKLEQCINSLAKSRGLLYASELHLVRKRTGETIDVFFTSNASNNVVWKIIYKNDVDDQEGDDEKFKNQREKKILAFWQNVLDKYGVPNAGTDSWASSDNAYDPLMTAYYGELELIDCGKYEDDNSLNIQHAQDNFAAKPYAF